MEEIGQNILLDSLPYLDRELEEMKDEVDAIITENLKETLSKESREILQKYPAPDSFFTRPLIAQEMKRHEIGGRLESIDLARYAVSQHSKEDSSLVDLRSASDSACSQVEYIKDSLMNLELLKKFGGDSWKISNYLTEKMVESLEQKVDENKMEITNINKKRKLVQSEAGVKLHAMEEKWIQLVNTKLQLEFLNSQMETND